MRNFLIISVLFLTSCTLSAQDNHQPQVSNSALVVSVPVPDSVIVFGETVHLNRLDMRERYDREINGFTYLHSTTMLYIKRANRYFPIIEPILKANDIPDDFKYLCVIESGLDTRALSTAKAAGLWQFMDSTAKTYGLEIRDGVDERYHIEKATEAACRYFQAAYNKFGKWTDVAATYNAGFARISNEESKQMVSSAFDLLLVQETSRYVFRIMACKAVFENPCNYGFFLKKEDLYPPVPLTLVAVKSDILDIASFAKDFGINYMQLKDFNVWLRDTKLTLPRNSSKTYQIAIPKKEDLYFNKKHVKVHDKNWVID